MGTIHIMFTASDIADIFQHGVSVGEATQHDNVTMIHTVQLQWSQEI